MSMIDKIWEFLKQKAHGHVNDNYASLSLSLYLSDTQRIRIPGNYVDFSHICNIKSHS